MQETGKGSLGSRACRVTRLQFYQAGMASAYYANRMVFYGPASTCRQLQFRKFVMVVSALACLHVFISISAR